MKIVRFGIDFDFNFACICCVVFGQLDLLPLEPAYSHVSMPLALATARADCDCDYTYLLSVSSGVKYLKATSLQLSLTMVAAVAAAAAAVAVAAAVIAISKELQKLILLSCRGVMLQCYSCRWQKEKRSHGTGMKIR